MANLKKQFLKTVYINKKKSNDNFDKIILVSKTEEGKSWQLIEKPAITYYITKPEEWDGKYVSSISKDRAYPVTSYNKGIIKSIVDNLQDPNLKAMYEFANRNRTTDSWKTLRDIHLDGRVHGSDINIEDFYIRAFNEKYEPTENFIGIEKGFMDIEVDSRDLGRFPDPEEALAPVNAISFFSEMSQTAYVFALKYDTDTYREFISRLSEMEAEVKEYYKEDFPDLQFNFQEFDYEADLLLSFLKLVNDEERPDFCGAWNLDFDFPTIYNRLIRLGFNPEEAFSSSDFPYKNAYFRLDNDLSKSVADRNSTFITSSYTTWIDQLATYASINKPMGVLESYKLDDIAERELGESKISLGEEEDDDTDITNVFMRNYYQFIRYSIHDTMLLALIERKVKHIDLLSQIASITCTRLSHAMKKTVSLRNLAAVYYEREHGMILSNNRSRLYPHTGEKKEGAFVGDPNLIDKVGIDIGNGNLSDKIFRFVTDLDLASLYPNIQIAFNISPETFVGPMRYKRVNPITGMEEDLTDHLVDSLNSRDSVKFGMEFYNLPSFLEMEEFVDAAIGNTD